MGSMRSLGVRGRQGVGVSSDRLKAAIKWQNRAEPFKQVNREQAASKKPQPQCQGGPEAVSVNHRDWPQNGRVPGPQRRGYHWWIEAGELHGAQEARQRS